MHRVLLVVCGWPRALLSLHAVSKVMSPEVVIDLTLPWLIHSSSFLSSHLQTLDYLNQHGKVGQLCFVLKARHSCSKIPLVCRESALFDRASRHSEYPFKYEQQEQPWNTPGGLAWQSQCTRPMSFSRRNSFDGKGECTEPRQCEVTEGLVYYYQCKDLLSIYVNSRLMFELYF